MPEPLTIVTGVSTLLSNAIKLLKDVQSTVSAIKNAPAHITAICNDLEDFCSVLGTLQIILDDEGYSSEPLQRTSLTNLQSILEHCVSVFTNLRRIVNGFSNRGGVAEQGKWKNFNWTLQEAEVDALRQELLAHKMTLNIEISLINFLNLRAAQLNAAELITAVHQYRQDVTETLESLRASQLGGTRTHTELDRAALELDAGYGLRRFLNSAPPSPSLQVSTLNDNLDSLDLATISDQVSFQTAFSRPVAAPRNPITRPRAVEPAVVTSQGREICIYLLLKRGLYDCPAQRKLVARPGDTVEDILSQTFAYLRGYLGDRDLDSSFGHLCYAGTRLPRDEKLDRFLSLERPVFFYYDPPVLRGFQMRTESRWAKKSTPTKTPEWTEHQEHGFKYRVATLSLDGPQLPWRSGPKSYRKRLDRLMSLQ